MRSLLLTVILLLVSLPAFALEKVTIAHFGSQKILIYLPLYVAMEEGLFEKQGIEVELRYSGNGDQTFAAVISGDADFGVADPIFTAISQEKGFGAKTVAALVQGVSIWGITNKKNIPTIKSPDDLSGLKIGSMPRPSTIYTMIKGMQNAHPEKLKDMRIIEAAIGTQLALLEADEVDIALAFEPAVSIAEGRGYRVVYSMSDFHGAFAFTGLNTIQERIDNKPDMIQKVVTALEEAVQLSHANPNIAVKVGKKIFPDLGAEIVQNAVSRMLKAGTYPRHVYVSDEAWQALLQSRLAVGDLQNPQETNVAVDNSFALKAQELIGH